MVTVIMISSSSSSGSSNIWSYSSSRVHSSRIQSSSLVVEVELVDTTTYNIMIWHHLRSSSNY